MTTWGSVFPKYGYHTDSVSPVPSPYRASYRAFVYGASYCMYGWCRTNQGPPPPSPAYRLRMNLCIMAPPLVLLVTPHARLTCNAMKGERSAATTGGNLSAVLGRRSVLARPSVSDLGPFRLAVHVNLDEHLRFGNLLSGWQGARSMRLVH